MNTLIILWGFLGHLSRYYCHQVIGTKSMRYQSVCQPVHQSIGSGGSRHPKEKKKKYLLTELLLVRRGRDMPRVAAILKGGNTPCCTYCTWTLGEHTRAEGEEKERDPAVDRRSFQGLSPREVH